MIAEKPCENIMFWFSKVCNQSCTKECFTLSVCDDAWGLSASNPKTGYNLVAHAPLQTRCHDTTRAAEPINGELANLSRLGYDTDQDGSRGTLCFYGVDSFGHVYRSKSSRALLSSWLVALPSTSSCKILLTDLFEAEKRENNLILSKALMTIEEIFSGVTVVNIINIVRIKVAEPQAPAHFHKFKEFTSKLK